MSLRPKPCLVVRQIFDSRTCAVVGERITVNLDAPDHCNPKIDEGLQELQRMVEEVGGNAFIELRPLHIFTTPAFGPAYHKWSISAVPVTVDFEDIKTSEVGSTSYCQN